MSSAAAVSNEFLDLGANEPGVPFIDQMKLQKLLFYAHAWRLALSGKPLFEEDFEAWPWGPVVRDVYSQTARFGRGPVTTRLTRMGKISDGRFGLITPRVEDADTRTFVRSVWDVHKQFTGIQLSNATHARGEPWTIIKESYPSLDSKPTIPNDLIKDVFQRKLKTGVNAN